jgi:dCMP deaminase
VSECPQSFFAGGPIDERQDRRDRRHFELAQHVAGSRLWSKDPSTRVAAVLIGQDPRHIAIGYNGFPPGIADTPERLADRAVKYDLVQHAERNVLDNATFDLRGATLATTMYPCHECAKSIISKRVQRVITPPYGDREPWLTSSRKAEAMFKEAPILVRLVRVP